MAEDLDYPGRGGLWLGVPGLILLAIGVLVLGESLYRWFADGVPTDRPDGVPTDRR